MIAQGIMNWPPTVTIGGRDLEERGLELPLVLLK